MILDSINTLDKSELRVRIVGLSDSLIEAKMSLMQLQKHIEQRDHRIQELEDAMTFKEKLVRKGELYFANTDGTIEDDPYCPHCWEKDHFAIHLTMPQPMVAVYRCSECKNIYHASCTKRC